MTKDRVSMQYIRRKTRMIKVGGVQVGGGAAISVQSMLNAPTTDVAACLAQLDALAEAGCDIARLAVPDMLSVKGFADIRERSPLPLVADIHFDHKLALECVAAGADKIRINPGNIGAEQNVKAVACACARRGIPIRVGVNAGSVEQELLAKYGGPTPEALCQSAQRHATLLERHGFGDICISIKSSSVTDTVAACRLLAEETDYPLHLGVTEAGTEYMGTVKSAVGIGGLLAIGIGDTIRVSLTGDPVREIVAAKAILKALGMGGGIDLISCPTCARCRVRLIDIAAEVERRCQGLETNRRVTVAVMGCEVNGPGEAREADVGLAGGDGSMSLFKKGKVVRKVPEEIAADVLMREIERMLDSEM